MHSVPCLSPALLVGAAGLLAGGAAVAFLWRAAVARARRILGSAGGDGRWRAAAPAAARADRIRRYRPPAHPPLPLRAAGPGEPRGLARRAHAGWRPHLRPHAPGGSPVRPPGAPWGVSPVTRDEACSVAMDAHETATSLRIIAEGLAQALMWWTTNRLGGERTGGGRATTRRLPSCAPLRSTPARRLEGLPQRTHSS